MNKWMNTVGPRIQGGKEYQTKSDGSSLGKMRAQQQRIREVEVTQVSTHRWVDKQILA